MRTFYSGSDAHCLRINSDNETAEIQYNKDGAGYGEAFTAGQFMIEAWGYEAP